MDCNPSTKMKDLVTPTLHGVKTSEKQTEEENSAAKQVLDSQDKLTARQKPLSKLGLPLEKKMEQEEKRRYVLFKEYNRRSCAVKKKEAELKELHRLLKINDLLPTNYNGEDACKQHITYLENNLDRMKMKIRGAERIQEAYEHIREHLQWEVRGMCNVMEEREKAVAIGQAKMDEVTEQFQSATAAADSTLGKMVQMKYETVAKKREMDIELCGLTTEDLELRRQMETLGQNRLRDHEIEAEEARSTPVTDPQCDATFGASQSDIKLMEDMEALRESLCCAHVQEIVNKVESQRATQEQLLTEVTQYEELTRQEARTLADLELQYTKLKLSAKPTRFDKGQMQTKLTQEVGRVQRLQAELKQSQDLLETVEEGVNNIYSRMSCIPVEGLSSTYSTDSIDQLRDISCRLPTLLQRASEQKSKMSSLDQEKVYSLLEQLNRMDLKNDKRPTTPMYSPQLSDEEEEEECSPSREKIKRCSSRLIESNKKTSRRAKRKQ